MNLIKKLSVCVLISSILISGTAFAQPTAAPTLPAETEAVSGTPSPSPAPDYTKQPELPDFDKDIPQPSGTPVSDASTPAPEENTLEDNSALSGKITSDKVSVHIDLLNRSNVKDSFAEFDLCDLDGTVLAHAKEWVGGITKELDLSFSIPEYEIGKHFLLKLTGGLTYAKYYDTKITPGQSFEFDTYAYTNNNGDLIISDSIALEGDPLWEMGVVVYYKKNMLNLSPKARLMDGVTMVPVRAVAESMGLNVKYDGRYESVVVSIGKKQLIFNIGNTYTTIDEWDFNAPHAPCYVNGSIFVPVRTLAEAFHSDIEVLYFDDHMDVLLGESRDFRNYMNQWAVNRNGIGSKTNYLVWVSKSEYKVRVFKGQQYNWQLINTFPCALGAWNTPTITGQFEYIERTRWDYNGYYVAPVLRFYNGYALHSTLLNYGGGEYDGRVGVNISHGCVRLHPQDINWIADIIPFYTRIYITE